MGIDFAALREVVSAKAASGARTLGAGLSAVLAALTVIYLIWPDTQSAPVEAAVIAAEPVFTPVAMTPPAPAPAQRPYQPMDSPSARLADDLNLTRDVQARLKRAGCYAGRVNGVWNPATSRAMAQFTFLVNARLPVDHPDPVLLVLLESHETVTCSADRGAPQPRREETASIDAPPAPAPPRAPAPEPEPETRAALAPDLAADADGLDEYDGSERDASSAWAGTAAATAAAAAAASATPRVAKPEGRVAKRKYRRKPSFSRSVSRSIRKLSRSLSKIF